MSQKKFPKFYPDGLLTFDTFPEGKDGQPNVFGGHAHSGQAREDALKRFANGDKSVWVYTNAEYRAERIEDPDLVNWGHRYRPVKEQS